VHQLELKRLQQANQISPLWDPKQLSRQQLDTFMNSINYASSLGIHVAKIPKEHPDREDALISLAAVELPGKTVIWSSDKKFQPVDRQIPVYDHTQLLQIIVLSNLH
jgi:cystathionine beta-lyase family protein involved in aluminum resistance